MKDSYDYICEICGDYKGVQSLVDHAECSIEKQKIHEKDRDNIRKAKKRLTKKTCETAGAYFSHNFT